MPVLVSSRGYGVLWDNPAVTDVSVGAGAEETIPAGQLYTEDGQAGGLTARYFRGENFDTLVATRTNAQIEFNWDVTPPADLPHDGYSVRWTGFIEAKSAGTYKLFTSTDDGVRLWVDDKLVIDAWNIRPAQTDIATIEFAANSRHRIRMDYYQSMGGAIARLAWQLPSNASTVTWTSQAAEAIDYYFMYGPELDQVIADYRDLTGAAPMFGKWAWGFWQSKEHYATQQELTNVVNRYRASKIPIDGIIQDWYYWNPNPWGSHQINPTNYPDVTQLMQMLHNANTHMIISVWAKFDVGSYPNYVQLNNAGALYSQTNGYGFRYYDAFNPIGRQLYWQQISNELFSSGIDGWWLDSSEPELSGNWGEYANYTTAAGSAAKVFNAFPLMHTTGVYHGQRASGSDKRVFILTRSAYAGQQRNAAVTWSGDIPPTWPVFKAQIPAGINFSMSGIPYWNTDIGGFTPANPSDPAYAELFTRWFQFGAFCPMFRVHGETIGNVGKEIWQFPAATEKILTGYDQLRYHLLPYIYSVSWMVSSQSYSMMRGLVMDFRSDTNVHNISDQYMFGPALMVSPVAQAGATNRNVYLPSGTTWWDFWTGQSYTGGKTIAAAAPIETMPLFVRAGSIIPYGPAIQYATESADPIELRVYRGADGNFTLYEDEGDNYNYEKGKYATIPISWKEATQTLTIGKREGSFPGMLKTRTFRVVGVSPDHGMGIPMTTNADAIIHYTGKTVKISVGK